MNKYVFILIPAIFISGCAAIEGYNYHAIAGSKHYMDCNGYLASAGGVGYTNISGPGNYVEIKRNGNNILLCSRGIYKESMYMFGPILPIIPMFGVGDSNPPKYIKFALINKSKQKEVKLRSEQNINWCIIPYKKYTTCDESRMTRQYINVPAQSILNIKMKYSDKATFKILLDDSETLDIKFRDEKGIFWVIAG